MLRLIWRQIRTDFYLSAPSKELHTGEFSNTMLLQWNGKAIFGSLIHLGMAWRHEVQGFDLKRKSESASYNHNQPAGLWSIVQAQKNRLIPNRLILRNVPSCIVMWENLARRGFLYKHWSNGIKTGNRDAQYSGQCDRRLHVQTGAGCGIVVTSEWSLQFVQIIDLILISSSSDKFVSVVNYKH